jgi:hypothetical protein
MLALGYKHGNSGLVTMSGRGEHPRQSEWCVGFEGHTDAGVGYL